MHETVKQMAQNFSKQRTLRRRAYAAFTALALVVSISTMYTLSQPAQTMTGDPVCGMAEHVHSDACYTMQLVCGVDSHAAPEAVEEPTAADETVVEEASVEAVSAVEESAPAESDAHEHDDSCYEQQEVLVCTLEEAEAHTHGDSCYGLSCGEDEYEAHTHGAECYQTRQELSCGEDEYEAHSHGAECYTTYAEQTCGEDEYEAHSHGSDCYTTSETLTCSEDESSGHTHSDGCYDEEGNQTCGESESSGHSHGSGCYTEETELTCSADEGPGHTHSDGCYTEYTELTCSAQEGAGHSHSDSCYTDVEELICALQDGPGHTHSDACNGLVCGLEETEGHSHDNGCYEMQDVLVCTADEEADAPDDDSADMPDVDQPSDDPAGHTDSCYERVLTCELEEHTHSSSCYEVPETAAPGADTEEPICGQEEHTHEDACYDEAGTLTCGLTEHTHSEACYPVTAPEVIPEETICGLAEHTHEDACYDEAGTLICGLEEHTHSEACYPVPERMMVLPEGAEVPEGYDHEYTYISEDATFGVAVYAPEGAIPEGAQLVAEVLAEDSDAYIAAGEALDAMMAEEAAVEEEATEEPAAEEVTESESTEEPAEEAAETEATEEPVVEEPAAEEAVESETPEEPVVEEPAEEEAAEETKPYDGYVAMDIRFEDADGYEVEPLAPVYVCINALGLLPEEVDPASVSVQHHAEVEPIATFSLRSLFAAPAEETAAEIIVETVADATEETGIVQVTENEDYNAQDVVTAFEVESFSSFTITWTNTDPATVITVHHVDWNGNEIGSNQTDVSTTGTVALSSYQQEIAGYTYVEAHVGYYSDTSTVAESLRINNNALEYSYITYDWRGNPTTNWETWPVDTPMDVYLVYKPSTVQTVDTISEGVTINVFNYSTSYGINDSDGSEIESESNNINFKHNLQFNKGGGSGNGLNNWTGFENDPRTDMVTSELGADGFPVLNAEKFKLTYPADTSLAYLFDTEPIGTAKLVYDNANYLFQQQYGYYVYDSDNNSASLNTTTKEFSVGAANGGFWPFGKGSNSNQSGYHFGMTVEASFIMPQDGIVDGQDMIFSFTGDDDLWVFIDGKLVLDLGGIHGATSGTINFATGTVTGQNGNLSTLTGTDWSPFTEHTIKIFYLERGAGESNCNIKFNLPVIPDNSLLIGKEVSESEDASVQDYMNNLNFYYRVLKAGTDDTLFVASGETYDVYDADTMRVVLENQTVDANGIITIKGGQIAVLGGVCEVTSEESYYVQELIPTDYRTQYSGVTINNATGTTTETSVTVGGKPYKSFATAALDPATAENRVIFENEINWDNISWLYITKSVIGGTDEEQAKAFNIQVNIGGKPLAVGTEYVIDGEVNPATVVSEGIISLKDGQVAMFPILAGTEYTVVETNVPETCESVSYISCVTKDGIEPINAAFTHPDGVSGKVDIVGSRTLVTVKNQFAVADGPLSLYKQIARTDGQTSSADADFQFQIRIPSDLAGTYEASYTGTPAGKSRLTEIAFTAEAGTDTAVGTVVLSHGETVTLTLPFDTMATITEVNTDGYAVSWTVDSGDVTHSNSVTATAVDADGVNVICTNSTGAELPSTGGIGTQSFTFLGTMLMLSAGVLLLIQRRRREGT